MELQELYSAMNQLVEDIREFLDEHENEDGELTAEDAATYETMNKKLNTLQNRIKRREEVKRADNFLRQPAIDETPVIPEPPMLGMGDFRPLSAKPVSNRASNEYKQAALAAIRSKFRVIRNDLATSPDSAGGYLIPTEWDSRLIETLSEENIMRKLGTSIKTSGEHKINVVATKPAATWTAEGQAMIFGNGTFEQLTLDAHKISIGILVTEELLADNQFNLENYIIDQFGNGIANAEEEAFITGDGNGKPTGFLTTIESNADMYTTTTGAAPSADDIINLVYSLPRPYRKNAAFLINDSTLAQIRKFKDATQAYLWQASYQAGEPDRLLGYPIYSTPYMPTAESGNFAIAFGDFSYYNIADRGERSFQELRELYVTNGLVGFLMKERVDGILVDNSAIRALKIK